MRDQFDGGIVKGTLPETFHHINVLDTPRMLRYRPNVEKFRIVLNNTTDDVTRQACITNAQERTMTMDHVSDKTFICSALNLTFDTLIVRRMQLYARGGTRALNGIDSCSPRRSDTERRTRTLLLPDEREGAHSCLIFAEPLVCLMSHSYYAAESGDHLKISVVERQLKMAGKQTDIYTRVVTYSVCKWEMRS